VSDLFVTYTQYGAIMLAGGNHGSCRNIATQSQHPITEAPIERQVPRHGDSLAARKWDHNGALAN